MAFQKGNIPWMRGREASEETRHKMSLVHKGKRHTDEAKRKISEAAKGNTHWLGKHHTEETKKKIGEGNKGKYITEETRQKIREKRKLQVMKPCSEETRRKRSKSQRGEGSHFWKGGISPKNQKIRHSIEIRLWRESVFARDNWTCQKCGIRGSREIHAHHIKPFATYPELRTSIENGVTLCRDCHYTLYSDLK